MNAAQHDNAARNTAQQGSHLRDASDRKSRKPLTRKLTQPAEGPLLCYWCEEPRSMCSCKRCALTGDLITSESVLYVVHDTIHVTGYGYRESDPNVVGPPQALNVHPFHGGTEGVGLSFSSLFARYLQAALKIEQSDERAEIEKWWTTEYGVRRVHHGLLRRLSAKAAQHVLDIMTIMCREEMDPADVADEYDHTASWVIAKFHLCMRLANERTSL